MNIKRVIITMAIFFAVVTLYVAINNNDSKPVSHNTDSNDDIVVIIDPGHGGEDGGAVSSNGVVESNVNLSYANKLNLIMNLNGYKTTLTRKDDSDLSDKSLKTVAQRKKSDMYKRLEQYNSDVHNVVISIHQNYFPANSCKGTQIFYSIINKSSKNLADNITNSVISRLQKDNHRISKPTNGNIFLLDNSKVPSIIVECGFLSNSEEVITLCNKNYQKKFCFCLFLGFLNTSF